MNINPEQLAVVESTAENILVLACPGSGKTRTLIARICKLIERGAKPEQIVCITYTRAAAAEIEKRLGEEYCSIKVETNIARDFSRMEEFKTTNKRGLYLGFNGTLHAFAFQMLSKHGTLIGLPKNLSIADEDHQEAMVESIMADLGVKASVKSVLPLLSRPDLIEQRPGNKTKAELVACAYHLTLRAAGLLDFESILFYFLKLIRNSDLEWPFKHLLYDEVQDSSDMDFQIIEAMPCETKFLVGDFDQQIYSWRGSNPKRLLEIAFACSNADIKHGG